MNFRPLNARYTGKTGKVLLQLRHKLFSTTRELEAKKIVNSWDEFSPLKHIIVGRPDGSCIAPNEEAIKYRLFVGSDMIGRHGPRSADSIKDAQKQMDNFCNKLRSHGITVDRPEPIDWNNQIKTPFFEIRSEFGSMPSRDILLTVGKEILEAPMSCRSRWFEYRAYRIEI